MATLQARFFLVAFAVIAAAIIYNATYRQTGSHPAPMSSDVGSQQKTVSANQTTGPRRARTLPRRSDVAALLPKDSNVIVVQRRLADTGYHPGPADGVLGDQTKAAIIAFELDNKLPLTGVANDRILRVMIMGGSPGDAGSDAPQAVPDETTAFIKSVQQTLSGLGYDPGPIDGLLGSSTETAIKKFEASRKLPVTGKINGRMVKELKQASGGRLSIIASN